MDGNSSVAAELLIMVSVLQSSDENKKIIQRIKNVFTLQAFMRTTELPIISFCFDDRLF